MFKSLSTSLIVRGILAVAVGIIALAWPQVTVLALVILFAVYALFASGLEAVRAFSSAKAAPLLAHLLLGLVDLAAGDELAQQECRECDPQKGGDHQEQPAHDKIAQGLAA